MNKPEKVSTISLFMIERMLEIEFRDEELDLRTSIGVIKVDTVAIRSGKMSDNVDGVDE